MAPVRQLPVAALSWPFAVAVDDSTDELFVSRDEPAAAVDVFSLSSCIHLRHLIIARSGAIHALASAPNGLLVVGSATGGFVVRRHNGAVVLRLGGDQRVGGVAATSDCALVRGAHTVAVYELFTGKCLHTFAAHPPQLQGDDGSWGRHIHVCGEELWVSAYTRLLVFHWRSGRFVREIELPDRTECTGVLVLGNEVLDAVALC